MTFFIKVIEHHQKYICSFIISSPGMGLLLTPRMGDHLGPFGTIWDHLGTILGPCQVHFESFLETPYANKCFQPKIIFLEITHTNFVSSIRKISISAPEVSFSFFEHNPKTYFKICSYIQKMTQNLIETFKTPIYSPKDIKNTKLHVNFFEIF